MSKTMVLDIETIPNLDLPESIQPQKPRGAEYEMEKLDLEIEAGPKVGNLKDPAKIDAKVFEFREKTEARKEELNLKISDEMTQWENIDLPKKMAVNPMLNKIVSLQFLVDGDIETGDENDEKTMLEHFWEVYPKTNRCVTQNGIEFDIPTIINRSMFHGIKTIPIIMKRYSKVPIYDVMQVMSGWRIDRAVSQDFLLEWLGLPVKSASGADVWPWYQAGEFGKIHEYCRDDIRGLWAIFNKIKPYYG